VSHNNVVPNAHFRKHWMRRVKTWFNQPARKARRKRARVLKAKRTFPRPLKSLRPVVRCPTVKYNKRQRLGRGFTLEELKEAKIPPKFAATIGISVDHRRRNRSLESLQMNVARLKAYKSNLMIIPRNKKHPKPFECSMEEVKTATQAFGRIMPPQKEKPVVEYAPVTEDMKKFRAYTKLRIARTNQKLAYKRAKKADEAEKAKK